MANDDKYIKKFAGFMEGNPKVKQVYDWLTSVFKEDDESVEVEIIKIDGKNYFVAKEFVVKGTTYVHLINKSDPLDIIYQKIIVENGKEYFVGLDSEQEFNLVIAYEQKYFLREVKRKQEMESDANE